MWAHKNSRSPWILTLHLLKILALGTVSPLPTLVVCCGLVTMSCPTLYNPMDSSPPTSSVHGILQAIILEWVAVPSPGDLPDPGIEPRSPALQADSLPSEPPGKPFIVKITAGRLTANFKRVRVPKFKVHLV